MDSSFRYSIRENNLFSEVIGPECSLENVAQCINTVATKWLDIPTGEQLCFMKALYMQQAEFSSVDPREYDVLLDLKSKKFVFRDPHLDNLTAAIHEIC